MIKPLLIIVAVTGVISILVAMTASHAMYVQVKVIRTEIILPTSQAKAETLSKYADETCMFFGILGVIQLGCAIIGLGRIARTTAGKERQLPNQPLNRMR